MARRVKAREDEAPLLLAMGKMRISFQSKLIQGFHGVCKVEDHCIAVCVVCLGCRKAYELRSCVRLHPLSLQDAKKREARSSVRDELSPMAS